MGERTRSFSVGFHKWVVISVDGLQHWIEEMLRNLENGDAGEEKRFFELSDDLQKIVLPLRKKIVEQRQQLDALNEKLNDTTEKLIREEKELYFFKEALDSLPNPIFVKNDKTEFIFFNREYEHFFNMKRDDRIGMRVGDLEYLSDADKLLYQQEDTEMIEKVSTIHYEIPFVLENDVVSHSLYWSTGFLVEQTHEKGLVGEIVDISMRKKLEDQLVVNIEKMEEAKSVAEKAYHTDFATGLGNRYLMAKALPKLLKKANQNKTPLSIFMADLDFFKSVNDTYGHNVGDEVLVAFSRVLQWVCQEPNFCLRYGGEEFLGILPDMTAEEGKEIAENICQSLAKYRLPDGKNVTVSIGVTEYIHGEQDNSLLVRVDKALYMKKNNGRNGVVVL
ncbi:MAG: diguanylate cyclase [Bacillota bacterium]